jgi:hypothetical protein
MLGYVKEESGGKRKRQEGGNQEARSGRREEIRKEGRRDEGGGREEKRSEGRRRRERRDLRSDARVLSKKKNATSTWDGFSKPSKFLLTPKIPKKDGLPANFTV